jgi:hypothetical protein
MDGSVIETDGTEVVPGVASGTGATTYSTPGHGIWQVSPCVCSFYIGYISVTVNAEGALQSTSTTVATVTLTTSTSSTTFTGQYTTTTSSPSGAPPKTTSGSITGRLIPHPKLP